MYPANEEYMKCRRVNIDFNMNMVCAILSLVTLSEADYRKAQSVNPQPGDTFWAVARVATSVGH